MSAARPFAADLAWLTVLLAALATSLRADPPADKPSVMVVDEDGRPIASARLAPAAPGPDLAPMLDPVGAPGIEADAEGRLTLPATPKPAEGGAWVVWAPGRAARRLLIQPSSFTILLARGAGVRGTVRWSGGRAAGGLELLVEPLDAPEPVAVRITTDAEGRYRTDLVAGSAWRVSFRRADGRWAPLRTAGSGTREHVAPQPGGLKGRLIDGRASGTVGAPGLSVRLVALPRGAASEPPVEAKSGHDGTFVLLDVAPAVYEVDLLDPEWMFDQASARVEVPGEGVVREEHWFVMRRPSLSGQVLGREAKPVGGARVRLLPDPRREGTPAVPPETPPAVTTDPEGRFHFVRLVPAEGYRILASAPGFAPVLSAPFPVEPGAETRVGALTLPSGWSLDVEVRDAASKLLPGALVRLASAGHPSAGLDPALEALTASARTGESGSASFVGLAEEDVWLTLSVPGHLPAVELVRRPGTSSHLSHRVALTAAPTLRGTLSDSLGRPAPGLVVRARPRGLGGADPRQVVSGPEGKFVLADLPLEALDVDVLAGERPLLHIEGVDPEQGSLDLSLPPLQSLSGTVEGLALAGPRPEVVLEAPILLPDEPEPRWRTVEQFVLPLGTTTNAFFFDRLSPGRYAVRARQGGRDTEALPVVVGDEPPEALSLVLPEGGSVAGAVVDGRGLAVLGVRVALVRLRGDGATAGLPGAPLLAVTGDRGGYVFSGVAAGLWRVEAGERGEGFDLEVVRVADAESLVVRDLSTGAGGTIAGQVEDDRGRPVDGARLSLRSLDGDLPGRVAVTGSDGGYRATGLPLGTYEVALADGPHARLRREALVVVSEGQTARVDFVPAGTASVEGTVLRGGRRATGVPLLVEWLPEEGEALERAQRVVTDGTGSFHVGGLVAGRYRLVLEDGVVRTGGDVQLADGARLTVDLELWEGRLTGEVLARDGRPLGNALVTARPTVPVVGLLEASTRTDPAGRFAFTGLPVARYDLAARAEGALAGGAYAAQADPAGSGHSVTIRLDVGTTLHVEVRGLDGRPASGVRVSVRASGPEETAEIVVLTGPSGRIVMEGVPAGRVRVVAEARDTGRAALWTDTVEGTVTQVRLALVPSGGIALEVRGADAEVLQRARYEVRSAGTGELVVGRVARPVGGAWLPGLRWRRGLLEARDLPAGDYEVLLWAGPGWVPGRALVRVRAGETTPARMDLVRAQR